MAAAKAASTFRVTVENCKDDNDYHGGQPLPKNKKPSGAQKRRRANAKQWALIPVSKVTDVPKPATAVQENHADWFCFTPRGREYIAAYWRAVLSRGNPFFNYGLARDP